MFEIWARRMGQKHAEYERVPIRCATLEFARDHIVQDLVGMGYLPNGATVTAEGDTQRLYQYLADPKDLAVMFAGMECRLKLSRYSNDRVAIHLIDVADEGPVATATVNLPDELLLPDQVFIKSYAENEGMLQALEEAGVVRRAGVVPCGHASAHVCELLVTPPEHLPARGQRRKSVLGYAVEGQEPMQGATQSRKSSRGR